MKTPKDAKRDLQDSLKGWVPLGDLAKIVGISHKAMVMRVFRGQIPEERLIQVGKCWLVYVADLVEDGRWDVIGGSRR